MKKRIAVIVSIVLVVIIVCVGGYFALFRKVPYEIVTSLPTDYPPNAFHAQRDRNKPVTIDVLEEYIGVLPPYGYDVEFIDVVKDGGIVMLYNLVKLEDPNGEAPALFVKVSNPRGGPLGAFCQNLDILPLYQVGT